MTTRIYELKRIPDLTLGKYTVQGKDTVQTVFEKHHVFLRQLHRAALLSGETIHWIYEYDPKESKGKRLKIFLKFDGEHSNGYADSLVRNSPLSPYYDIVRVVPLMNLKEYRDYLEKIGDEAELARPVSEQTVSFDGDKSYEYMAVLQKREKFAGADRRNPNAYYSVSRWRMNENARLFTMLTMMKTMNQPCVYCVDVKPTDLSTELERPYVLGNVIAALRELSGERTARKEADYADYTLRRYEELIEDVSANPHFFANIRVYANHPEYAAMLLDAAAAEALDEGAHDIHVEKGYFTGTEVTEGNVCPFCNEKAPKELEFWSTLFLQKELLPFVTFPILYAGERIELPKETAPSMDASGLFLGLDSDGKEVCLPMEKLQGHAFIAGGLGSGKTNTMLQLAVQMSGKRVPFLLLAGEGKEYRTLVKAGGIEGVTVFSTAPGTIFPLHINPFEFPAQMTVAEHIHELLSVFGAVFGASEEELFHFGSAMEKVYADKGWLPYTINTGGLEYPTLEEWYHALSGQGETFVGSLLARESGDLFNVPYSTLKPEEWLERTILLELTVLGDTASDFLLLFLVTMLREVLQFNVPEKTKMIRHAVFLDDIQNYTVMPQVGTGLAELRALKETVIFAKQLPAETNQEIVRNTSVKLAHRVDLADDRKMLGEMMAADPAELERLAAFGAGETLAIYEGLLKPFEFRVQNLAGDDGITDDELCTILSEQDNSFYQRDMEKSFEIVCHKMDLSWESIQEAAVAFEERLDEVVALGGQIDESQKRLADVDWSKVDKTKRDEIMRIKNDTLESQEERILSFREEYDMLCDRMEETIFFLYSYKQQNRFFEKPLQDFMIRKFLQYRNFAHSIKMKCGFERSREQEERRSKLLRQWDEIDFSDT